MRIRNPAFYSPLFACFSPLRCLSFYSTLLVFHGPLHFFLRPLACQFCIPLPVILCSLPVILCPLSFFLTPPCLFFLHPLVFFTLSYLLEYSDDEYPYKGLSSLRILRKYLKKLYYHTVFCATVPSIVNHKWGSPITSNKLYGSSFRSCCWLYDYLQYSKCL